MRNDVAAADRLILLTWLEIMTLPLSKFFQPMLAQLRSLFTRNQHDTNRLSIDDQPTTPTPRNALAQRDAQQQQQQPEQSHNDGNNNNVVVVLLEATDCRTPTPPPPSPPPPSASQLVSPIINRLPWSRARVLTGERMLTDNEIYAASELLRHQFGHIRGLFDPQALNAKAIKRFQFHVKFPDRFVQIVHDGHLHWLTISNVHSHHASHVQAYDSLYNLTTYADNTALRACLRKLMLPAAAAAVGSNKEVAIVNELVLVECSIEAVQVQSDRAMCGLFAIAFAYDLCSGLDPTTRTYDESQMRSHLAKCLRQGYFQHFPSLLVGDRTLEEEANMGSRTLTPRTDAHILFIELQSNSI